MALQHAREVTEISPPRPSGSARDEGSLGLGFVPRPALTDGVGAVERGVVKARLFGELGPSAKIGRFIVLRTLGEGGMGVVYAAYDQELDRKVALKLMRALPGLTSDESRKRMQREAQAMARLSHPNVVQVYEVGMFREQLFVAMEFIEGVTLAAWRRERAGAGDGQWRELLKLMIQAGRGLAAAHEAGLVHRDFKPENVMIGRSGRVRVLDFGLARPHELGAGVEPSATWRLTDAAARGRGGALALNLTRTGALLGTPAYMSPEQHRMKAADARSDQFSFCVALYEALTDQHPYAGDTRETLALEVNNALIREWPTDSRVPGWLRKAVMRGLSPSPEDRWPSMDELLEALEQRPRRKRLGAALALALTTAAALFAVLGARLLADRSAICTGGQAEVDAVWGQERRAAVERAIRAAAPGTRARWDAVRGRVDAYTADWLARRREACEATNLRKEQSTQTLDLRMECLGRRLEELDALLEVLAGGDAPAAGRAIEATSALLTSRAATTWWRSAPARAWSRRPTRATSRPRSRRCAASSTGPRPSAPPGCSSRRARASRTRSSARALAYRPLEAEIHARLGAVLLELDERDDAARALTEALWVAEETRNDEVAAEALANLITLELKVGARRNAMARVRHAEALMARLGLDRRAHARLVESVGALLSGDAGKGKDNDKTLDDASEAFQRIYYLERSLNPERASLADFLRQRADDLYAQGDFAGAARDYEWVLRYKRQSLGPEHAELPALMDQLGDALRQQGRLKSAASQHLAAYKQRQRALGSEHPDVGSSLYKLGVVSAAQRKDKRARGYLKRALKLWGKVLDAPDDDRVAWTLLALADVDGRHRGTRRAAEESYAAGISMLERLHGAEDPILIEPLIGSAELALSSSQADASATLERAVAIAAAAEDAPQQRGAARFALARALWAEGSGASKARARRARARPRATSATRRARGEAARDAVRAWLAKRA
ncbi:MAG: serine/threonine protein kinase [Myxococcales bacterium]|nr:serine/threonine protein kinase [Myxococcales bacterium]